MENTIRAAAEAIVREIPEGGEQGCWATLPGTEEHCPDTAVLKVYGLPFCEVHGAEIRAGALAELYHDAEMFLERLDNPHVPEPNPAALAVIRSGAEELCQAVHKANDEDDAALLRAYPLRRELMDEDLRDFDYEDRRQTENGVPEDWCRDHRLVLHKLMRLAYEKPVAYVVEALDEDRRHVSEQLAYVMVDYEERGAPRRRVQA